jgi:hypothetical protein
MKRGFSLTHRTLFMCFEQFRVVTEVFNNCVFLHSHYELKLSEVLRVIKLTTKNNLK